MSIAAPTQAHDGKVETIVGAENLTVTLCARTDSQTCRSYRERIEKFTPTNHFVSPLNQQKSVLFNLVWDAPHLLRELRNHPRKYFRSRNLLLPILRHNGKSRAAPSIHKK